jgi:hypothetical protein
VASATYKGVRSTLAALWIDRFAGSANCWSSWARCLGPSSASPWALIVEHAETSSAVAALGRERAAVLAASPPSSQPPASRAASSQDAADGSDTSGNQRAQSADRADQRAGKADTKGESRGDKAGGRGKKQPGKSKGNDE